MHTLRLCLVLLLGLVACDPEEPAGDADAYCAELATRNEGCWTPALDADCLDVHAECGENNILILESCPVQLACAD